MYKRKEKKDKLVTTIILEVKLLEKPDNATSLPITDQACVH